MKCYKFTYTIRDAGTAPAPWSPLWQIIIKAPTKKGAEKHLLKKYFTYEVVIYQCVEVEEKENEISDFY